jgi:hypothetical protein
MSRPIHFAIQASNPQTLIDFYAGLFGSEPGINGGLLPRRGPPPDGNIFGMMQSDPTAA